MVTSGVELIIDAYDCDPLALASRERLIALIDRMTDDLHLIRLAEPVWHVFPEPGGITGLVLLSESHLAVHTFPESGFAALNLYRCQRRPLTWQWEVHLREALGARRVEVRTIPRGSRGRGALD